MGRSRVNYSQLRRMQRKVQKLSQMEYVKFCEDAAKEIAARLLAKVIKRTPVGVYEDGRTGGTLRRGWTVDSHRDAFKSSTPSVKSYTESMTVTKVGSVYQVEVFNPVEYAAYVEYGHRTRNGKGWVPGRFMMTISASEVEQAAPAILERKLMTFLKGVFNGD